MAAVSKVAAALQTQVLRDAGPAWGVTATVDAFPSIDDVPVTYYPIIVRDDIGFDAAGIHLDQDFTPYALVGATNRWTLTASHEVLELLCDPFGNRLQPGPSLKSGQGLVEYLVEVCDPSEAVSFSYLIDGVVVSDFYLPSFFDPVPNDRVRYSFTGACRRPLEVREGGYISWRNPVDSRWWQQVWFGTAQPQIVDLGVFTGDGTESFRSWLDGQVRESRREAVEGVPQGTDEHEMLVAAYALGLQDEEGTVARAERLKREIGEPGVLTLN
jgi:hypothetical protein